MLLQKFVATALTLALLGKTLVKVNANDTFNFYGTNLSQRSFGPSDWQNVTCNAVETCPGWPTNWENFNSFLPYSARGNQCIDCSKPPSTIDATRACRAGYQSPINLVRSITNSSTCFDRHRMNYIRGNCRFSKMDFQILPHVLRVYQPPDCDITSTIDFSRGYPVPWQLEFTDLSVPSQHLQDGRRYDAEIILHHTYGRNGLDRLLGSVSVFLELGNETDHYDFLELYLRGWARTALKVERDCILRAAKRLQQTTTTTTTALLETTLDSENDNDDEWNNDDDYVNDERLDQEFRALLKESIEAGKTDLPMRHGDSDEYENNDTTNDEIHDEPEKRRRLTGQIFAARMRRPPTRSPTRSPSPTMTPKPTITNRPSPSPSESSMPSSSPTVAIEMLNFTFFKRRWHPYDWLEKCNTEYYFKYLGSLLEPPCFVGVHWRVMMRPIKISPRQLRILGNLTATRQDPVTCKKGATVGKPRADNSGRVDVNRPIQLLQSRQDLAFCECVDWNSSFTADKAYCTLSMQQRGVFDRVEGTP